MKKWIKYIIEVRPSVGGVVLYSGWFNDVAENVLSQS